MTDTLPAEYFTEKTRRNVFGTNAWQGNRNATFAPMNLQQAFEERVGAHRVEIRQNPLHPEQSLIFMFLEMQVPVTIVMTNGLSDYKMPVSPKWQGREFNEIYFCLPTYWDFEDVSNNNQNWIYTWLFKLESFVREKQTWFGPGHTVPAGNPPAPISVTMKQDHFIFLDPMFTEDVMNSMQVEGKTVRFLAIVPLFSDEVDYKMGKGTFKVVKKFMHKKFNEVLDDYRASFMKSRMRFW